MADEANYLPRNIISSDGGTPIYLDGDSISGGISWGSSWNTQQFQLSAVKSSPAASTDYIDNVFLMDIAQSHFFTVSLSSIIAQNGRPIQFNVGEGTYKGFLPVKSIGVNYSGYDNMAVPFAVLSDIPILHRKKTPSISLVCYDLDDDCVERAVNAWNNLCFPQNKYVAYIDSVKAKFEYKSYDTKGVLNFTKSLWVIPTGSISVNRDYGENSEKLVTFGIAAIGTYGDDNTMDANGYNSGNKKTTESLYRY